MFTETNLFTYTRPVKFNRQIIKDIKYPAKYFGLAILKIPIKHHCTVEPSTRYSFMYRILEGDTSKTTIYDQKMSYGNTVKPSQTTHNVAH